MKTSSDPQAAAAIEKKIEKQEWTDSCLIGSFKFLRDESEYQEKCQEAPFDTEQELIVFKKVVYICFCFCRFKHN